jgi:hypothetical protein
MTNTDLYPLFACEEGISLSACSDRRGSFQLQNFMPGKMCSKDGNKYNYLYVIRKKDSEKE